MRNGGDGGAQPLLGTVAVQAVVPQGVDMNGGNFKGQIAQYQLVGKARNVHKMAWQDGQ